ncbi:MAG: translation initiation factor IF-2 associated domain-containing protein, partial [Burkholderiaceae bacterium]
MAANNVESFAAELKLTVDVLIEQLKAAGVKKSSGADSLSEADKERLLEALRKAHGGTQDAPRKKITITKRQTSEIRQADPSGKSRTIQVEVRKKRVFVKREESEAVESPAAEAPPVISEEEQARREAAEREAAMASARAASATLDALRAAETTEALREALSCAEAFASSLPEQAALMLSVARERVERLKDAGTRIFEAGTLVNHDQRFGKLTSPGAGVVTAFVRVEGR